MTSPPLDSTHGRQRRAWHDITALGENTQSATSCVVCHHRPWTAHMVRRRRAWHDITALGQHTWSEDVGCGMTSPPLDGKQGQTTSGVACHHHLWEVQTVERHRVWHSIIAFGLAHIVRRRRAWHAIIALGRQTRSNHVGRGMPSSPLGSTHGRTTSSVASHHHLWTAHTVEQRRVWYAIIAFG